ncbi:MAG: hypothetical protein EBR82_32640 [Caulobacteraceae bacterium]|jgi:hypothetical protein|nr:hypothetical protein [Caulobacteraceae bacterium]
MNQSYDPFGYGSYSGQLPASREMFIDQAGDRAKLESQKEFLPYTQGAGTLLGGLLGSIFPGAGTAIGASLGGALGSAAAGLFGGNEEEEAQIEAGEIYDQRAAEQLWSQRQQSSEEMDSNRMSQMLFEIQNMRKNVMPNRTEYLKFV